MRARIRSVVIDIAAALARPFLQGSGCIVCLHRVLPEEQRSPLPCNRSLELSTDGLRAVLQWVRRRGLEPIAMDQVPERLSNRKGPKFIAFTLDDGYRDNAVHALPIFREFGVPFTVNVTTGFVNGDAQPWWYVAEAAVRGRSVVAAPWLGSGSFAFTTHAERDAAAELISSRLRAMEHAERSQRLAELCDLLGFDAAAITRELILSWEELREFASDPLVTIGAHGVTHSAMAALGPDQAIKEIERSRDELREHLGAAPKHLAYPFGGPSAATERDFALTRQAGFVTAVTTRSGNLTRDHSVTLHSLPRIGISGNYDPVPRMRRLESGMSL